MFYIVTIISVFAYALQGALLARFARKMDPLVITAWRNTSLALTMSPFLLIAGWENTLAVIPWIPTLIGAGIFGATFVWVQLHSFTFLPVGIATSLRQGSRVLLAVPLGYFFFGEVVRWQEIILMLVILCGTSIIGFAKNAMPHLNDHAARGLSLCVFAGFLHTGTFFLMGEAARNLHPLVAGYFWEALIGVCAWLLLLGRKLFFQRAIPRITLRDFFHILLASFPTVLGTALSAYAITLGPFGEFSAIGSLGLVFASWLGVLLYQERLSLLQWSGISICVLGILGLKIV